MPSDESDLPATPTDSVPGTYRSESHSKPEPHDGPEDQVGPGGHASRVSDLEDLASQLAESHTISRRPRRRSPLLDRLSEYETLLRAAYEYFVEMSDAQPALSYAAEWLLDNFYVVRQALRQVREDMPKGYYRQLPKLATAPLKGYPRICALAWEVLRYCQGRVDLDQVTRFVRAYQRTTPLTMGELWALPTMLRLGVLECLALAVTRVIEQAQELPVQGLSISPVASPELENGTASFPGSFDAGNPPPQWEGCLAPSPEGLTDETIVANCIISLRTLATQDWKAFFERVSRVDAALRCDPADVYAHMDFGTRDRYRKAVEELALAADREEEEIAWEAVRLALERLPPGMARFSLWEGSSGSRPDSVRMDEGRPGDAEQGESTSSQTSAIPSTRVRGKGPDFVGRDRELGPSEGLEGDFLQCGDLGESEPRRERWRGLRLPRETHVGFYLLGAGRVQLESRLGYRPPWSVRGRRWVFNHPALIYLGGIALITLLILSGLVGYAVAADGTVLQWIGTALLCFLPATAVAIGMVNWFLTRTVPPRILPKMDFRQGVPPECRTMVVIPALLSDSDEVASLLQQLELHFWSNVDPYVRFALLTDFADAPQKHMPGDDALLEQVERGIRDLNRKYGQGTSRRQAVEPLGTQPFYLFHRERRWNPGEQCWMGWERKRGKLVEFNRLLRDASGESTDLPRVIAQSMDVQSFQDLPVDGTLSPDHASCLVGSALNDSDEVAETSSHRAGSDTSYCVQIGDLDLLSDVKYVITLDADTSLPRDSARRLIATLAHPLNRATFDPDSGAVVAGYTVLQPRVEIRPTEANRSLFTRFFAGDTGVDLYTRAVSDVYHDFLGEGIYAGKGIYDVDAFERSLTGRVPENTLLSHDLFEGIHGRAGLVTDVILYEDYPAHYLAYTRRLHRWVRGDWQLLPWLLPWVPRADGETMPSGLSAFDRWKILDNLRRSLLAPALLVLLIAGWLWLPGSALIWTLVGLLALCVPTLTGMVNALGQGMQDVPLGRSMRSVWMDAARWLLAFAFLLYETLVMIDAVGCTLVRVIITRERLLQWTTSAHTIRLFGKETKLGTLWEEMGAAPLLALELALLVLLVNPEALPAASPLLLAWLVSPYVAHRISQPVTKEQVPLSAEQRRKLRCVARRTWLYFEQFVGPDDHWLPPDHFQEEPRGLAAHRTSPTNIGLLLLSTLGAYDLGYIGPVDLMLRLRATFEGMGELKRYWGHFLNWYETRNLEPLPPRYVSTVDSGNLAGCLLALRQGLLTLPDDPVLRWQRWQGLLDALSILTEIVDRLRPEPAEGLGGEGLEVAVAALEAHLADMYQQVIAVQDDPASWLPLLAELSDGGWQELDRLLKALVESDALTMDTGALHDLRVWSERVYHQLRSVESELSLLLRWFEHLSQPPALFTQSELPSAIAEAWQSLVDALPITLRLGDVPQVCKVGEARVTQLQARLVDEIGPVDQVEEARAWCADLAESLAFARMVAESLLIGCQDLSALAESTFQGMDFGFLYDARRQVFHLGYNVEAGKLDDNHYDLLASEARIASFVALAKGNVPQGHWLHLARPLSQFDHMRVLLSWNGGMFEYLMPILLMRSYPGTLLHQTYQAVVMRQIAYGRQKSVPWGISESGYYGFDASLNYQYRGFGVPGLGFKRGLGEEMVVSSYASMLALPIRPQAVVENVDHLAELGMLGRYGLYEAIDYTRERLPLEQKYGIVRSYMVHHQGMILLSLVNYFRDAAMVRRFHADPRMQSVELLLQERIPQQAPVETPHPEEVGVLPPVQPRPALEPWQAAVDGPLPQAHFLSNGRYGVLISSAGGGYSSWQEVDLTRWRADTTLDNWGTWLYVQDRDSGDLWSAGFQPTGTSPEGQEVLFHAHKAEFRRRDHDISLCMEVAVAPGDDVEVRRVVLTNNGDRVRRLMLTSYGEVVLSARDADRRHPAFNKLFVESEYLPEVNGLLFRRRPRSADERPIYLIHSLVVAPGEEVTGAYESDRARFLGRCRTARAPIALTSADFDFGKVRLRQTQSSRDGVEPRQDGYGLSRTTGATLEPVMSLGQAVELGPHETVKLAYITLAARSRGEGLALARRYRTFPAVDRVFDQARSRSELELNQLDLTTSQVEHIQQLLSVLLYPHPSLRADPEVLATNRKGQPGLWTYAISGDYPILLVRVESQEETALVRELLRAHAYWRNRQIKVDLVILNQLDTGYAHELQDQLHRLVTRTGNDVWMNRRGGVFLLRAEQMSEADRVLLETAARVVLDGKRGRLAEQVRLSLRERRAHLPRFVPTLSHPSDGSVPSSMGRETCCKPADLLLNNGLGGFSSDGREYVIYLEAGRWTPAPWVNVIANPEFGFLVSEAGAGCTWAGNSGENRLTSWWNDPVSDIPGEAIYLRDEEVGHVWSPTPLPAGAEAPYLVRHGAGYSVFEHVSHGLRQRLRLFAVPDASVKVVQLRLENTGDRNRRITATYYAEWVLGPDRDVHQQYVIPEFDAVSNAMLARNPYNEEFGERVAFLAASREPHSLTADRTEFLGRYGSLSHPDALDRVGLASSVRAGLDPCAALQVHVWLAPGETEEVCFLLGQGADRQEALRLVERYGDVEQVEAAWESVGEFWDGLLDAVTVRTPDPGMDLLLNRWLLYQTLACRLWGRSAFYQSSGAFGYRDQLQDAMAVVYAGPGIAREHILRAACHQFEEGDVLHWWHPPSGRGVRTRCSDDLLWLPFVTAHYVTTTGDGSILTERMPFLKGDPLDEGEMERYGHYEATTEAYTLYEHCRRALEKGTTAGPHDLPLIGSHDWNDGLSNVGVEGRGESVWLGWFLYATLMRFAVICELVGDDGQATVYRRRARDLSQALESSGWDGQWYRRAYYDDGTPLGSLENRECQIDSIAQSWAVLSGAADAERARAAMDAVAKRLVRDEDQLVLLFTPPFDKTAREPGYIKGYLPGVRENGGQYTHAAIWAVWAFAKLGQGDRAGALFRLLNPIYHSDTARKMMRYRVEPYVVAADIYSVSPHVGRGGWTWYTGSAGWMYRLGLEAILGLRRVGDALRIRPCIPKDWSGYELTYRDGETSYFIRVENPDGVNRGVKRITLDGEVLSGEDVPLQDDGREHDVHVLMGL